ncbi:MAG: ImmA/IrrE family metallo-endopeptidase, partial [Clostridium sp.]
MKYDFIHKSVLKLKKKYKTSNPLNLAKELNIDVCYKETTSLKGFYVNILRNKYIVLSSTLTEEEIRIICAHELGHHILHRNLGIKMFQDELCISKIKSIPEIEANYFAAELLIDDEDMEELISYGYSYEEIAAELGVHKELVIIKGTLLNKRGYKLK